jgi:uncharacterized protein YxeA
MKMKKNTIIIILVVLGIAGSFLIWRSLNAGIDTDASMDMTPTTTRVSKKAMRLKEQAATRNEGQITSLNDQIKANEKAIERLPEGDAHRMYLENRNVTLRNKLSKLQ